MAQVTQLPLELTPEQVGYMFDACESIGALRQVIYAYDSEGWILVGNDQSSEGDGVWVDQAGQEHHGPSR